AKAAGDAEKVKELEAWGQEFQRQLHFQGFGRAPVDDLLAPLAAEIRAFAASRHLAVIVMSCDYVSDEVELVDVTDDLVKLYDPSPQTLKTVAEIRAVKPVALTKLADVPATD
ncbi:MAG: hypothetical protein KDA42_06995, partial [Planctomycetales bacterium]|nr:hypothetical protein [Planctomycetales bacterium]